MLAQTLPYCPQCIELWQGSCRHVDTSIVVSNAAHFLHLSKHLPLCSIHPSLHFSMGYEMELLQWIIEMQLFLDATVYDTVIVFVLFCFIPAPCLFLSLFDWLSDQKYREWPLKQAGLPTSTWVFVCVCVCERETGRCGGGSVTSVTALGCLGDSRIWMASQGDQTLFSLCSRSLSPSLLCRLMPPLHNLWRNLINESMKKAGCPVSHLHSNNDTGTKERNYDRAICHSSTGRLNPSFLRAS